MFTFKTVMGRIPLSVKLIVQHSTILIVRSERTIRLIHYVQRYFVVKNAQYILKENVSTKSLKSMQYPMQETEYYFLGFIVPYPLPLWGNPISRIREFFAFGTAGIKNCWRNCFMECEILGFGIQKLTQGIRNPADDWIPLTRNLSRVSSTWSPECRG